MDLDSNTTAIAASILANLKIAKKHAEDLSKSNHQCMDIYKNSGRKRAPNCKLKISDVAISDFEKLGFKSYLQRAHLTEATKTSIENQFAQFISFVKQESSQTLPKAVSKTTKAILLWIIDYKRNMFGTYADSLQCGASNVVTRIEAIIHAVRFLNTIHSDNKSHHYTDAIDALQTIRAAFFRTSTSDRKISNDTDALIRACAYPRGGLRQIRDHLNDGWQLFDALVAAAQAGYKLSELEYLECMRYVLATLWGYDNNARGLAIERVCLDDIDRISVDEHDFVLSNHFKTYAHYQYQTISFSHIVKDIWVPIIRSQVASKTGITRVFINYRGNPVSDGEVSKHVGRWFRRYGLFINVTTLRKVLESSYAEAEANDVIDADTRSNLTRAQGHSDETAQQYYIVGAKAAKSVMDAVKNVESFDTVVTALAMDDIDIPDRVDAIRQRQSVYEGVLDSSTFGAEWYGKVTCGGRRYEWTESELGWLEVWFRHIMPLDQPNRYAACLHAIHTAPKDEKAIFHPHHVYNSDRLKSGAQRAEERIKRLSSLI
jgi:hypothetical protein